MSAGDIHLDIRRSDAGAEVQVRGELDIATAPRVDHALDTLWQERTATTLDLGGVDFLDSTALRVLLIAARRARDDGWRFRIVGLQGQARRSIELMGLLDVLPIVG